MPAFENLELEAAYQTWVKGLQKWGAEVNDNEELRQLFIRNHQLFFHRQPFFPFKKQNEKT